MLRQTICKLGPRILKKFYRAMNNTLFDFHVSLASLFITLCEGATRISDPVRRCLKVVIKGMGAAGSIVRILYWQQI